MPKITNRGHTYNIAVLSATLILTMVFIVYGWLLYNKNSYSGEAVETYSNLLIALEKNNLEDAWYNWDILLSKFRKSIYAALAAMRMAKIAADANSDELAIQQLELVVSNTNFQALKDIARLRIARLLIAKGRVYDAETQLYYVNCSNFTAECEEIIGDIAVINGDYIKANTAFNSAIAAVKEFGIPLPLMLKASDLLSQK